MVVDYTATFSNIDIDVTLKIDMASKSVTVQDISLEPISGIYLNDNIYHKYDKLAQVIRDKFISKARDNIDANMVRSLINNQIHDQMTQHLNQLKFSTN